MTISSRTYAIVFSLASCLCISVSAQAAPVQFGNNFYDLISSDNITWQDADTAAASSNFMGVFGHLATITSQAENDFLMNNFRRTPPSLRARG